jgi:epoxyqueuosine reductase
VVQNKLPLKQYIHSLGFGLVGFTKSKVLDKEAAQLESWLNNNYQGEMTYMERYFDMRIDPSKLLPGTKSIIVLGLNYYQEQKKQSEDHPNISMYAYGKDYHKVIRTKTKEIIKWMKLQYGDITARSFVDSGPVLERSWAREAGISWSAKNTLSIHPKIGSYFFLSCILTDLEFEYDHPIKDYCGTCRKCIDACPTEAIHHDGYLLDASKCISYLTIELRKEIPDEFQGKMNDWIFGCDICQQVCPWNRFSKKTQEEDFKELNQLTEKKYEDWLEMNESEFDRLFKDSPLKRPKLEGIKRNIRFAMEGQNDHPD